MNQKTALVTGAAGFLGSHLVEELLKDSFTVLGIDNFSTGLKSNVDLLKSHPEFLFQEADVAQAWDWKNNFDPDFWSRLKYIFHFASPASPKYFSSMNLEIIAANTRGLENCLTMAGNSARVIFASTSEIYGDPQAHPQPEEYWGYVNSFGPRSSYNESKRLGESLIYAFNERYSTQHGLVRIFNAYGPRMNPKDGRVVNEMLRCALQGEDIIVHGDGSQKRSFCYVDDLVRGILMYADHGFKFPMNLGSDQELSIFELAHLIQDICHDLKPKVVFGNPNPDDPRIRRPDLSLAINKMPEWKLLTPLKVGLIHTKLWLKDRL